MLLLAPCVTAGELAVRLLLAPPIAVIAALRGRSDTTHTGLSEDEGAGCGKEEREREMEGVRE